MAILLMLFALVKSLKLPMNLNSESSRKLLLIDLAERSLVPILLLSAAVLYKLSGAFYDIMDIRKQSQQRSLVL